MTRKFLRGSGAAVHRIDLPCSHTGFSAPPFDVHLKFLPSPSSAGWTVLALTAPGRPDLVAKWLRAQPGVDRVRVAPGLAPRLLRARVAHLPKSWAMVAAHGRVHHLDLAADGHAAWFIEGLHDQVLELVRHLAQESPTAEGGADVHCRPVQGPRSATGLSRRQFEALSAAVALGYYEIPHRIDLRALARRTHVSLGSISELLRRAEATVLTQYVDSHLMQWPVSEDEAADQFRPLENVLRPTLQPAPAPPPEPDRPWPIVRPSPAAPRAPGGTNMSAGPARSTQPRPSPPVDPVSRRQPT